MQVRQWMVTHEWMTKPMAQTEWIERRGILVWIAEVFTSLGAGLYLVSLFFNNWWGMLAAWVIIMFLKVPLHIAYFGKPFRFWRTVPPFTKTFNTSWFCRGITFTILFSGFAVIQLVITFFFPRSPVDILFKVFGGITAFLVGIYSAFIMNYCKSVPFWNSALLPLVFIFAGVADGLALLMAIGLGGGNVNLEAAEIGSRMILTINAFIIASYLVSATYSSATAKLSAMELIKGKFVKAFWLGIVLLGIIIPLLISGVTYLLGTTIIPLLIFAILCHTVSAFYLKYSLLKVGIHKPLFPINSIR